MKNEIVQINPKIKNQTIVYVDPAQSMFFTWLPSPFDEIYPIDDTAMNPHIQRPNQIKLMKKNIAGMKRILLVCAK